VASEISLEGGTAGLLRLSELPEDFLPLDGGGKVGVDKAA
jgi:hypothetical protein